MSARVQTKREEIANTITHGIGILFSLIAIPMLVISALQKSDASTVWAVSIFGFGMLMVYMSSTLYHAIQKHEAKRLLQIWDHVSIFLLIAGTYTPVLVKYTDSKTCFIFLSIMWLIAGLGSVMKIFFTGKYEVVSVILYLILGWMAIFIFKTLMANVPAPVMFWLVLGGLAYTSGVIFFLWKKLQYSHAVWHVFVLTGTVTHFFAVYYSIPIHIKL
jgi:hemolysin III